MNRFKVQKMILIILTILLGGNLQAWDEISAQQILSPNPDVITSDIRDSAGESVIMDSYMNEGKYDLESPIVSFSADSGEINQLYYLNEYNEFEQIRITNNVTEFNNQLERFYQYEYDKKIFRKDQEAYDEQYVDISEHITELEIQLLTASNEQDSNLSYHQELSDYLSTLRSDLNYASEMSNSMSAAESQYDEVENESYYDASNDWYQEVLHLESEIISVEAELTELINRDSELTQTIDMYQENLTLLNETKAELEAIQLDDPYHADMEELWKLAYQDSQNSHVLQINLTETSEFYQFKWHIVNIDRENDVSLLTEVQIENSLYATEYILEANEEYFSTQEETIADEESKETEESESIEENSQDKIDEDYAVLSFNLNGAPEIEPLTVKLGETLTDEQIESINQYIEQLASEGYEFLNWTTADVSGLDIFEAQLAEPFDISQTISKDITLTAVWLVNPAEIDESNDLLYQITFDLNGGQSDVPIESIEVRSGETLTADQIETLNQAELTMEGHNFLYWTDEIPSSAEEIEEMTENIDGVDSETVLESEAEDELPKEYDFSDPMTEDVTLYAVWSDEFYTVTFETQSGSEVEPLKIAKGEPVVKELAENTPVDNPANTVEVHSNVTELGVGVTEREGYDFAYWSVEAGEQLARLDVSTVQETDGPVIMPDNFNYGEPFNFTEPQFEDITLYAVWDNQAYNAETSAETQIITADTYTGPDSYESDNFNLLSMFNTQELTPGEIEVSKVATPVEGTVNTWDITLTLNGINYESDEKADIVIVLDTSGSMGDNRRLTNAKAAANQLIDIMAGNPNVRIGLVSFESGATVRHNLLSMDNPANVTALKNTISNFRANGGTHTQAGIRAGQSVLISDDNIADYMILLSDGEPTYSYGINNPQSFLVPVTADDLPPNQWGNPQIWNYHIGLNVPQDAYNTNQRVGTGNSIFQRIQYSTGYYNNANSARNEARYAKAKGTNIFSIGVDLDPFTNQILADIASPGKNYPAASSDLEAVFSDIAQTILTEAFGRDMDVTDPIGEGFTLIDGTIDVSQHSGTEPGYTFENNRIIWNIGDSEGIENPEIFSAEMTYRVEINPDIVDVDVTNMVDEKLYLTNGLTFVTYTDINEILQTVVFKVPLVDPLLLTIKKVVLDAYGNEVSATEEFTVDITNDSDFNQTFFLNYNNEFSTLSTYLRMNENYTITETGSNLDNYRTTITINNGDPVSGTSADFTVTGEYVEKTSSTGVSYDENQQDDIEITITNQETGINLDFRKQDASTKEGLANVNFTLTPIDSNGIDGAAVDFTTGSSPAGSYQFESLEPGRYKLQEVAPLEGYIAQTEPVYFELSIDDATAVISLTDAGGSPIEYDFAFIEENQTIVIENMKPVELNLRKVDGSDKDLALANIEFQIQDAAGNIVQSVNQEDLIAMTNSDGLASFTEFEPGTYYLVENETTLPANYQGLREPLEFTIERDAENQISLTLTNANDNDAQVITEEGSILLEIYNYRKGEYPDTGGPGSILYYLAGSILIIIAGSVYYLKFIRRRTF